MTKDNALRKEFFRELSFGARKQTRRKGYHLPARIAKGNK